MELSGDIFSQRPMSFRRSVSNTSSQYQLLLRNSKAILITGGVSFLITSSLSMFLCKLGGSWKRIGPSLDLMVPSRSRKKAHGPSMSSNRFSCVISLGTLNEKRNPVLAFSSQFFSVSSLGTPWKLALISTAGNTPE